MLRFQRMAARADGFNAGDAQVIETGDVQAIENVPTSDVAKKFRPSGAG